MSKKEGVMDADKAIAFFHDYVNGEGELLENGEPKSVPMSKEEALELQKLGAYESPEESEIRFLAQAEAVLEQSGY